MGLLHFSLPALVSIGLTDVHQKHTSTLQRLLFTCSCSSFCKIHYAWRHSPFYVFTGTKQTDSRTQESTHEPTILCSDRFGHLPLVGPSQRSAQVSCKATNNFSCMQILIPTNRLQKLLGKETSKFHKNSCNKLILNYSTLINIDLLSSIGQSK